MSDDLNEIEAVNVAAGTYDDVDEVLDRQGDPPFGFTFDGEAGEIFQRLLGEMEGFGVTVTTQDGEAIEGFITKHPEEIEMYDEVTIKVVTDWNEDEMDKLPVRHVRVTNVHVH